MQVRRMRNADTPAVYAMIQAVDLPRELFVKDDRATVQRQVPYSYVAEVNGKVVGALLIQAHLIDTVVSWHKGAATAMIQKLSGKYVTFVAEGNTRSRNMFERNGFKAVGKLQMYGEERMMYEGVL